MNKSFVYTLKQDTENTNIWYFSLFRTKDDIESSAKPLLIIKVHADNGRFTLQKSANLDLKLVADCLNKLLEALRLIYDVKK